MGEVVKFERRKYTRKACDHQANLTTDYSILTGRLVDFSFNGFRFQVEEGYIDGVLTESDGASYVSSGDKFFLEVNGARVLTEVRWTRDNHIGLELVSNLSAHKLAA